MIPSSHKRLSALLFSLADNYLVTCFCRFVNSIKNLHADKDSAYSKYMDDAIFKIPTPLVLDKVVTSLDDIYELMKISSDTDVRGDVYEYLLNKIAQSGLNGQFRTPRHIIKMMVAMMQPKPDDVICDPACGTSGFLVSAGEYLKDNYKEEIFFNKQKKDHYMNHMFFGYDMDRTMLRIGAMTRGCFFGSRLFVNDMFKRFKKYFSTTRTTGARKIPCTIDGEKLYTVRALRKSPIEISHHIS